MLQCLVIDLSFGDPLMLFALSGSFGDLLVIKNDRDWSNLSAVPLRSCGQGIFGHNPRHRAIRVHSQVDSRL